MCGEKASGPVSVNQHEFQPQVTAFSCLVVIVRSKITEEGSMNGILEERGGLKY